MTHDHDAIAAVCERARLDLKRLDAMRAELHPMVLRLKAEGGHEEDIRTLARVFIEFQAEIYETALSSIHLHACRIPGYNYHPDYIAFRARWQLLAEECRDELELYR